MTPTYILRGAYAEHEDQVANFLDYIGAPWSGKRSIAYRLATMYMRGTPGIFRIRRRSSRSHVATI